MHLLCALDARSQRETRYPATTTASATTTTTASIAVGRVERFSGCRGRGAGAGGAPGPRARGGGAGGGRPGGGGALPQYAFGRLRPIFGALLQETHDQRREARWNPRPLKLDRSWLLRGVRGKERNGTTSGERMRASQDLVRHHAERIEVRSVIHRRVDRDLLGGHVRRCADRNTDRRQRLALHRTTTRRTVVRLSFGTLEGFRDADGTAHPQANARFADRSGGQIAGVAEANAQL